MKRIDRYILTSYIGPMVMTFVIVLFVLLLQFIWLYIDEIVGKGLGVAVIAEFVFWAAVTFIPLALPLSTMLASLMTMGDLGESNELLAMKAAGMSVQRIMRPLTGMALITCIAAFFVSNNLLPLANLKINSLMYDIRAKREEIKIPSGVFYNGLQDYSIRISRQNQESGMMFDLILYDHTTKSGNTSVTLADSGYIKFTNDKKYLIFKLFTGHTYEDQKQNPGDTIYPFQKRYFNEQEVLIPLSGYDFKRSDNDDLFKDNAQMQSIGTLNYLSDSLQRMEALITDNFGRNFMHQVALARAQELDTASSFRSQYMHIINVDSLLTTGTIENQSDIISHAINKATQAIGQIDMQISSFEQYDYTLRRVEIEWHRKFTLSIACLAFFFIGAPLGAIIRKGGLGMPTVISIFFFVIYWVVDITGKKLVRDDVWSAETGMWLSSFVLLPIGIFITYKATTDSALFNPDRYLRLLKPVVNFFKKRRHV